MVHPGSLLTTDRCVGEHILCPAPETCDPTHSVRRVIRHTDTRVTGHPPSSQLTAYKTHLDGSAGSARCEKVMRRLIDCRYLRWVSSFITWEILPL